MDRILLIVCLGFSMLFFSLCCIPYISLSWIFLLFCFRGRRRKIIKICIIIYSCFWLYRRLCSASFILLPCSISCKLFLVLAQKILIIQNSLQSNLYSVETQVFDHLFRCILLISLFDSNYLGTIDVSLWFSNPCSKKIQFESILMESHNSFLRSDVDLYSYMQSWFWRTISDLANLDL